MKIILSSLIDNNHSQHNKQRISSSPLEILLINLTYPPPSNDEHTHIIGKKILPFTKKTINMCIDIIQQSIHGCLASMFAGIQQTVMFKMALELNMSLKLLRKYFRRVY